MDTSSKLFAGKSEKQDVWMSHGDRVTSLPEGFSTYASGHSCEIAAIGDEERKFMGFNTIQKFIILIWKRFTASFRIRYLRSKRRLDNGELR